MIQNREIKNAGWLIAGQTAQIVISFIVNILTARYLGPSDYGIINYAGAYVAFFSSVAGLGVNSVILKSFSDYPDEQGVTLGSALLMRFIASCLSALSMISIVWVVDKGEYTTIVVAILCSSQLVFRSFDSINYWFQYQYRSKITAIIGLIAYIIVSIYKVILLIIEKDVRWFAFATSLDFFVVSLLLFVFYKKNNGQKLKFSKQRAKNILTNSYHYIISGMMITLYSHTATFFLKQICNSEEVGYYTLANTIANMWTFVLTAIIDSMYPTIVTLHKEDLEEFKKKNRQLYCIVFYVSVVVSLGFLMLGKTFVLLLYGEQFIGAVRPLIILSFSIAFSYLGVSRNSWVLCMKKQRYLKWMYFIAAIINISLNILLIPVHGCFGAAISALITQICTSLVIPFFFKEMRPNVRLIFEAIQFKEIK